MDTLKPTRQGRPHALQMRLTREEKRLITKAAKALKVEPSVYARAVVLEAVAQAGVT